MSIDGWSGEVAVNCLKCVHYFITWDPSFPRGCKLFGFKTAAHPNSTVVEATGSQCRNYVIKRAGDSAQNGDSA